MGARGSKMEPDKLFEEAVKIKGVTSCGSCSTLINDDATFHSGYCGDIRCQTKDGITFTFNNIDSIEGLPFDIHAQMGIAIRQCRYRYEKTRAKKCFGQPPV